MWLAKVVLSLAGIYVVLLVLVYAMQTRMLFPTGLASASRGHLPASAAALTLETADGERLVGVRIPPSRDGTGERVTIVGFGGNAWNAENVAVYLHELFPAADVFAFHYRGYPPSTGTPSAAALLADAPIVHDHIVETAGGARVVAVGLSIGSGPAAYLARQRPLAGLILVSPFDSLHALASEHFPWVPARWLLRHRIPTAEFLRGLSTPTAVIAAGADTIVPPERTEALRRVIPHLALNRTIPGAGHNNLYDRPEFRRAMVEALAHLVPTP